jgi:hypothetical protein
MEKSDYSEIVDYVTAGAFSQELGALVLTSISDREKQLVLDAVQKDRLRETMARIEQRYQQLEPFISDQARQEYQIMPRIQRLETGQAMEADENEDSNLMSIWDIENYLMTLNFPPVAARNIKGVLLRAGTRIEVSNRRYIPDLVIYKEGELSNPEPLRFRFINVKVLEEAYFNGTLTKITGFGPKRMEMIHDIIEHWHEITGQQLPVAKIGFKRS